MVKDLLIDVGSTFIKYRLFDSAVGVMMCDGSVPFPRGECYGEDVADAVRGVFLAVAEHHPRRAFICVQMHGYITEQGGTVSPYSSWRDANGRVEAVSDSDMDFSALGTALKANLPLVKLWGKPRCDAFYTLGSYICKALTGINATHVTDACASGFYYAANGAVNGYAPSVNMPRAYTEVTPIGKYGDCLIYTPVGDHQASYLGAGGDALLLNIGTASQLSVLGEVGEDGCGEARPYFCGNKRLYTVSGLVGGDCLYRGEGIDELEKQLSRALDILPKRSDIILGGGGAETVFSSLRTFFEKRGMTCTMSEARIGLDGLAVLASRLRIKSGTMLSEVQFANFPIIAKNAGLDFIIADNEHGAFDSTFTARLVMNSRLVGMDCIVRLGDSDRGTVTRLADMGVRGFLLPMCNTADDIKKVVRYAKYAPIGERGISTTRAHTMYSPPPLAEYMPIANEEMKIYAQIETVKGVENCASILGTRGVEGVLIGPNDLSADPRCAFSREVLARLIRQVADTAGRMKKPWGIITADEELTELAIDLGASMISRGSELNMLINGCKKIRERL
ncbi:MAG: hypothetical protein IIW21_05450 [Clostridia bacterium]|nr:hypothetical protein [Clostridia bacterium]